MEPKTHTSCRLVKNEDLNHHGTLYAGRSAEWFVEAGFIAAASLTRPENIVCVKIHGMVFSRPVQPGEIIVLESKVVATGRSSLHAYVSMISKGIVVMDGFITFVNVDHDGRSLPHGVTIEPVTDEDRALRQRIRDLLHQSAQLRS